MNISKWIIISLLIVGLTGAASAVYNWFKPSSVITKTEYTKVPEIKEVVKIKKIKVPVKEVVTLEKEAVVKKLELPDWIKEDQNKQVIATGVVDPYEGKTNVVSLLDIKTGEGEIVAKRQPLSFIAFESIKEIGVRAGMTTNGIGGDVYGRWSFLRVGNIHTAFYAEGEMQSEHSTGKAMIDVRYQW